MKWYQRIFKSMIRQPLRYLILFLVVFLLNSVLLGSLSLKNSAKSIENLFKESLGAVATIQGEENSLNKNGYYSQPEDYDRIFHDYQQLIEKCSQSDTLKYSSYSYFQPLMKVDGVIDADDSGFGAWLIGSSNIQLQNQRTGYLEIVEGRSFTEEELMEGNVAVIRNTLQYQDGSEIELGDKITVFYNDRREYLHGDFQFPKIELTVIGKYEVKKEVDFTNIMIFDGIYVPNSVVLSYSKEARKNLENYFKIDDLMKIRKEVNGWEVTGYDYFLPCGIYAPYFELENYSLLDEFQAYCEDELKKTGSISNIYHFVSTAQTAERILEPMNQIGDLADLIMMISILLISMIVFLFIWLNSKKRTHEIGIYLSLGEKKRNIIKQFCGEILLIGCLVILCLGFSYRRINQWIITNVIHTIEIDREDETEITDSDYVVDPNGLAERFDYKKVVIQDDSGFASCVLMILGECLFGSLISIWLIVNQKPNDNLM